MTPLRILLIEDETMIATLLAEVLESMGHDVCGIEATELGAVAGAILYRPDLMIVDARLGDDSGLFAVAEIIRRGFIPHVFVSGDAARVRALRPDAVVLQKPFREAELTRAMKLAMRESGLPRQPSIPPSGDPIVA
jgi:DNA-binding response OmpR family regulator